MKIRAGLVSNSSSSSFTCLIKEDAYDKAYEEAHPFVRAVMDKMAGETDVFGLTVMLVEDYTDSGGDWSRWDDDPVEFEGERPHTKWGNMSEDDAWQVFEKSIPDDDKWITSQDW